MRIFFLIFFLLFTTCVFAIDNNSVDISADQEKAINKQKIEKIAFYENKLKSIEKEISDENMWVKSYSSYLTSLDVKNNLKKIKKRINYLSKHAKTLSDRDELNALISKESILTSQVEKLNLFLSLN
jgi:predicted  nucleic acid-binding Zn-ribbon protein